MLLGQVRLAVLSNMLSKYFSDKDGAAPLEKIGPYAYDVMRSIGTSNLIVCYCEYVLNLLAHDVTM